jgi:hypothetical protein
MDMKPSFNFRKEEYMDAWLRRFATSRKVAGSIPDEVIGFYFQFT